MGEPHSAWLSSLLLQTLSAMSAALVFTIWIKPDLFRVLLDKENNDYPSLGRQGQFTALIVSTWVLVAEAITSHVSEWLFGGYMLAWAGAAFGSLYLKSKGQPVPQQPTMTMTSPEGATATIKGPATAPPQKQSSFAEGV